MSSMYPNPCIASIHKKIFGRIFIVKMMKIINHIGKKNKQKANGGKLKRRWDHIEKKDSRNELRCWKYVSFFQIRIKMKKKKIKQDFAEINNIQVLRVMMIFFLHHFICILFSIFYTMDSITFFNNRRECDVFRQKITCKVFLIIDTTRF